MSDLTIDQYADVLAHMDHFGHDNGPEIRERLGIDETTWKAGEPRCIDAVRKDTQSGEHELAISFGQRFAATKEQLGKEQPALETIGSARPVDETEQESGVSALESTQAAEGGSTPLPDAPPPVVLGAFRVSDGAAPFAEPPPAPMKAPAQPPRMLTPPRVQPPSVVEIRRPQPPAPVGAGVDETALFEGLVMSEVLPFDDQPTDQVQARIGTSPKSATVVTSGFTGEMPAILVDVNTTLPFVDMSQIDFGDDGGRRDEQLRARLTLEQFASLWAELAVRPQVRAEVLKRYGVNEQALPEIQRAWQSQFQHSPEDRARFEHLVAQYRAWLASHR